MDIGFGNDQNKFIDETSLDMSAHSIITEKPHGGA